MRGLIQSGRRERERERERERDRLDERQREWRCRSESVPGARARSCRSAHPAFPTCRTVPSSSHWMEARSSHLLACDANGNWCDGRPTPSSRKLMKTMSIPVGMRLPCATAACLASFVSSMDATHACIVRAGGSATRGCRAENEQGAHPSAICGAALPPPTGEPSCGGRNSRQRRTR